MFRRSQKGGHTKRALPFGYQPSDPFFQAGPQRTRCPSSFDVSPLRKRGSQAGGGAGNGSRIPSLYSGALGIDTCVEMIVRLYGKKFCER